MLREMAKMSQQEAWEWCVARHGEAIKAVAADRISREVGESIKAWASEARVSYLAAVSIGLIPVDQFYGMGGGEHERR